jgi:hypothetical protein
MAITAFLTFGEISPSPTRMRFWLPVSFAICWQAGSGSVPSSLQPGVSA